MSGPILTLDNLFNGSNQEETLEVVEVLPVATAARGNTGTIPLPLDYVDFESVSILMGSGPDLASYGQASIDGAALKRQSWVSHIEYTDGTGINILRVDVDTTLGELSWTGFGARAQWPLQILGYKKRYSTTSLEQLLVMAQKPNLFVNSDHTKLPFNQRNFDGNWSALSDGQYGLDRWMKYSSTHKGFAVDDGEYLPNTPYTFDAEGITRKTLISPASGIWGIAVPFAADKMNGRCGRVLGDWHPEVQESKENSCLRHFVMGIGYYIPTPVTGQLASAVITYPSIMRKVPSLTRLVVTGTATFNSFQKVSEKAVSIVLNGAAGTSQSGELQADASITKAEVGRWDVLS